TDTESDRAVLAGSGLDVRAARGCSVRLPPSDYDLLLDAHHAPAHRLRRQVSSATARRSASAHLRLDGARTLLDDNPAPHRDDHIRLGRFDLLQGVPRAAQRDGDLRRCEAVDVEVPTPDRP